MTFERMKEEIKFREYIVDETISPNENPEYFSGFDNLKYLSKNNLSFKDARCLNGHYNERAFGNLGKRCSSLKDVFREMQYNAFMHGNKWDKELSISVKTGYGDEGFVIQLIDSGEGFDYFATFEKSKKNEHGNHKGAGFRCFNLYPSNKISFEGKGNIVNAMTKFSGDDLKLWQDNIMIHNLPSKFDSL